MDVEIANQQTKYSKTEEIEKFPQYDSAIERNAASFSQLVNVTYGRDPKLATDKEKIPTYDYYCPLILQAFEKRYGGIVDIYCCSHHQAAAVLTENDHFFVEYSLKGHLEIERLLMKVEHLAIEAQRLLSGKDLKACTTQQYSAAKRLLCLADCERDNEEIPAITALVEQQLNESQKYHERAARLKAQRSYLKGILYCLIGVVILTVSWILMIEFEKVKPPPYHVNFFVSLLGGGFGALVSVMSRMSFGTFSIDHEVGTSMVWQLGLMRPILGAVFGLALFALLKSGIIESNLLPDDSTASIFFFAIGGFLAGFSERWVPDLLAVTEERLSTGSKSHGRTTSNQTSSEN